MKKSSIVAVGLASAVAALMAGCSTQSQTADCVDATGRVVSDSYCSGGGYYSSYHTHWVYGGTYHSYGGYSHVIGGSTTPRVGASISSRSGTSISHGGFGGFGASHGGFGHGGS
jgi:hypothetical protein